MMVAGGEAFRIKGETSCFYTTSAQDESYPCSHVGGGLWSLLLARDETK